MIINSKKKDGWGVENGLFILFVLYFSAYLLLCYNYKHYIVPVWGYYGFDLKPDDIKMSESVAMLFYLVLILPSKPRKPSDLLVHLFFLMPVLPMLVLYGLENLDRNYMYYVILAITILQLTKNIPTGSSSGSGVVSQKKLMIICLFISTIVIISIIGFGGYKYFNLNIWKVYDYRRAAEANLPDIYGYLSPPTGEIVLPFTILLAINNKKYSFALLGSIASILMFALTSNKGPLFYPFAIIGLFYIYKNKKILIILVSSFLLCIVASDVSLYLFDSDDVANLFIRRTVFIPAEINFKYYQFFSHHPLVYLSDSKITFGLVEYPFQLVPQKMLGEYYHNDNDMSLNTGWLGTGYMHFGEFGLIFFGFIIGLLLRLLDKLAYNKDKGLAASLVTIPFSELFMSSDIFTTLLTHGMFVAFILLWAYNDSSLIRSNPQK